MAETRNKRQAIARDKCEVIPDASPDTKLKAYQVTTELRKIRISKKTPVSWLGEVGHELSKMKWSAYYSGNCRDQAYLAHRLRRTELSPRLVP